MPAIWSEAEIQYVRDNFENLTDGEIAAHLAVATGRPVTTQAVREIRRKRKMDRNNKGRPARVPLSKLKNRPSEAKEITVFVYHDMDHGTMEIFKTLSAAKAYGDEQWPGSVDEPWEANGDGTAWDRGEYETIYQRTAK